MDLKRLNGQNETPKSKIVGKLFSTDSPLAVSSSYSTPPSKFMKIFNPFERHLIDRVHLPMLSASPSVFNSVVNEEKFQWSIDDISNLKPADIDESTVDHHVNEHDAHYESILQERISKFFCEKHIVPSPMSTELVKPVKLIMSPSPLTITKDFKDSCAQTQLSLPAKLPQEVENVLKPYFGESKETAINFNSSLHNRLFTFESPESNANVSRISTKFSPLQTSLPVYTEKTSGTPSRPPYLDNCDLSPIATTIRLSKSACKLDFSENMSVDASLIVPDIGNPVNISVDENYFASISASLNNSSNNWEMEYKQFTFSQSSNDSDKMDVSNSNTPHSKQFTSQRKRLSESFKDEEIQENDLLKTDEFYRKSRKQLVDNTDAGYSTASLLDETHFNGPAFASTPSKRSQIF